LTDEAHDRAQPSRHDSADDDHDNEMMMIVMMIQYQLVSSVAYTGQLIASVLLADWRCAGYIHIEG